MSQGWVWLSLSLCILSVDGREFRVGFKRNRYDEKLKLNLILVGIKETHKRTCGCIFIKKINLPIYNFQKNHKEVTNCILSQIIYKN